jgi:hypothetical protein
MTRGVVIDEPDPASEPFNFLLKVLDALAHV